MSSLETISRVTPTASSIVSSTTPITLSGALGSTSAQLQDITGSVAQSIILPPVNNPTLTYGFNFLISNRSSATTTVYAAGPINGLTASSYTFGAITSITVASVIGSFPAGPGTFYIVTSTGLQTIPYTTYAAGVFTFVASGSGTAPMDSLVSTDISSVVSAQTSVQVQVTCIDNTGGSGTNGWYSPPTSAITLSSAGGSTSLVNNGSAPSLATKGLTAGNGILLSSDATSVTLNYTNIQTLTFLDPSGSKGNLVDVVYNNNTIAGVRNIVNNSVFAWANSSGGGENNDFGRDISTDTNGNSYVVGEFSDAAAFGGLFVLNSSGGLNTFVGLVNPNGVWQWAVNVPSASPADNNTGKLISNDCNGNAYVCGTLPASNTTFGATIIAGVGYYIAKINSAGVWQWAISTPPLVINDIKTDCVGNSYIIGTFFGSFTFGPVMLTPFGTADIFVAKINTSGTWLWAVQAGGVGLSQPGFSNYLTIDLLGNVYAAGQFTGTTNFGSIVLTDNISETMYVGQISPSGSWLWAVKPTSAGDSNSRARSINVDLDGNLYVSGVNTLHIIGAATMELGNTTIPPDYGFIAKMIARTQEWVWVEPFASKGYPLYGIQIDQKGDIYAFTNIANIGGNPQIWNFGPYTFTLPEPAMGGFYQSIYFKLGTNGNWIWYIASNVTNANGPSGLSIDFNGNLYSIGYFFGGVIFSPFSIGGTGFSIFVNKIRTSDVGTIGFLAANTTSGNPALVAFPGGTPIVDTFASSLVPAYNYFIDYNGAFSTCGCSAKRFLGIAMNPTTLMTGTSKGVNIFHK